ncbi:TlyA family RNA methyltransferase [Desulfitobacterium metallireducens]|uniref:RNA methyltransferase n=1 Tax=Desulfitobacterium metallireducens DSM 15288 TaxID=871968 RepID=W0E9D6_9FIRM|nr:TlyA family RNA methyltransferase [Desulfitobacterium metallireducens]AHF07372.1 RNA methyltransferase [Desulfitobacterium metallireducens DSM 15288]
MAKGKERLDVLLVQQGLFQSREKAKAAIMEGIVFAGGQRADKPGMDFSETTVFEIRGNTLPYVSRGGLKLEKALKVFPIELSQCVLADLGASTGGFTDCALQNGAQRVYAIDVGYGQLDWKLRTDPRVVSMERVNARYLTAEDLPEKMDWVVSDLAFISVTKVFPAMRAILKDEGQVLSLIKPQFEAGREHVGKKGVVRDPEVHAQVLWMVLGQAENLGFTVRGVDFSPIRGPEGNIEYLAWLSVQSDQGIDWQSKVSELVKEAQSGTE